MNLLRDQAILDLNRRNVEVLTEQLKQTRDRFNVGEVTRTDVAQAESRLAAGRSQLLHTIELHHFAGELPAGNRCQSWPPRSRHAGRSAVAFALIARDHRGRDDESLGAGVDVRRRRCRTRGENQRRRFIPISGLPLPTPQSYDIQPQVLRQTNVSILGLLTVPIYQGGAEYSAIRQNKETLGQQRLNLDVNRDQARATVVQSWGQLDAAKAQIEATTAQVYAAEIALNGVREEARVGQRTTLDVLNAQQELVNARVALVTAQHDRVVASYTLLAAVGELSMQRLGLKVMVYDPQVHYQQVRDAWIGVRTPDGR